MLIQKCPKCVFIWQKQYHHWQNNNGMGRVSTKERKPVREPGLKERKGRDSNPRNPKDFGMTYPKKQLGLYDPLGKAKTV